MQTESEGMKKVFRTNGNQKKVGIATLTWHKIDFKPKSITRDKEGHSVMTKRSVHQEDIMFIHIYSFNIGAPKYIKQILTDQKGEIDSSTQIAGDFNIPLWTMDRSPR